MSQPAQIFATCIVDTLYPEVGEAVVRVLQRAGAQVEFPLDQTCCGQPAFNAGMRLEARRMAKQTVQVLETAPGPVVYGPTFVYRAPRYVRPWLYVPGQPVRNALRATFR